MKKFGFRRASVLMLSMLFMQAGCARMGRGRAFLDKDRGATITEEELEALGISPELSARGMVFADTTKLMDVFFDYDKSDIKPDARKILDENVKWLKEHPMVKVQIEGHCDERGTVEYNLALGQRRASSVRSYLSASGIAARRLFTISYGEEQPVDPGHNEQAWAKNRRAHFKIKAK